MPGTTPGGLPYPLPTEPIADGADAIRNLAEAVDLRGTFPVVPASLPAGATVDSSGWMTWTPMPTPVDIDGVFTSDVRAHIIQISVEGAATSGALNLQFRAGGVVTSATNYGYTRLTVNASATPLLSSGQNAIQLLSSFPAGGGLLELDVYNAGRTARKYLSARGSGIGNGYYVSGSLDNSTAHDGFRLSGMTSGASLVLGIRILAR